jgi:hypothetical protein
MRRATDSGERTTIRPYVPGCPCWDCARSLAAMTPPDIDTLQSASDTEPGWEAVSGRSPLEQWHADGER